MKPDNLLWRSAVVACLLADFWPPQASAQNLIVLSPHKLIRVQDQHQRGDYVRIRNIGTVPLNPTVQVVGPGSCREDFWGVFKPPTPIAPGDERVMKVNKDCVVQVLVENSVKRNPPGYAPETSRPGGTSKVSWDVEDHTLSLEPADIDSSFFDQGSGAGTADPLWGSQIEISSFDNWVEWFTPNAAGDAQNAAEYRVLGGKGALLITNSGNTLLSAEIPSLTTTIGDIELLATLENVSIQNTIGSAILSQFETALAQDGLLQLEIRPTTTRLSTATIGEAEVLGSNGYMEDGSVFTRLGVVAVVPEPATLGLLALAAAALTRRALAG